MKKSRNKIQCGITLISLVITIIILLILAGITINLTIGNKGLFNKAKQGKDEYMHAANTEQEEIANVAESIDKLATEEYFNYDKPYIPEGFKYIEGKWNTGYTIREKATGNDFVWVPCVLDQEKVKPDDTVVTFGKTLPTTTEITDEYYKYNAYNLNISENDGYNSNEIKNSVGKYGGFYIARYEAGIAGNKENYILPEKTKIDGTVKPLSQAGCGVWNYIKIEDAITVAEKMIDNSTGVKSTLISGAAWDTTLQWMVNASDNKTINSKYDIDSKGKGWYSTSKSTTGVFAVNNIYDMAGNVWELTTETTDVNPVCIRGGLYSLDPTTYPAAFRANTGTPQNEQFGFRVVMYKM